MDASSVLVKFEDAPGRGNFFPSKKNVKLEKQRIANFFSTRYFLGKISVSRVSKAWQARESESSKKKFNDVERT